MSNSNPLAPDLVAIIQHIHLSKSGWWQRTVAKMIIGALWYTNTGLPESSVGKAIQECITGVDIVQDDITTAIQELLSSGDIFVKDKLLYLSLDRKKTVEADIARLDKIENDAKVLFCAHLNNLHHNTNASDMWRLFRDHCLIPLIREMGVCTYNYVQFGDSRSQDLEIVEHFLASRPKEERQLLRQCITAFLDPHQDAVRQFLLSHMTASYGVSALHLPRKALERISSAKKSRPEFVLLLDSNFLYSVLELHDNPANESAIRLLSLLQAVKEFVSVSLYVAPLTVDEIKKNLYANMMDVEGIQASPNISSVARMHLSGVICKYFQTVGNYATQQTAKDYFSPYLNNLIDVLRSKGVEVLNENMDRYKRNQSVIDDINEQVSHYGDDGKRYNSIVHDVVLWHIASEKRPARVESPVDAKYWVVTIDFRFRGFDSYKLKGQTNAVGVCLHPSQLLQMLQFWVPNSKEYEEAIVDAVRMPFFHQDFDKETEQLTITILKQISRYEGADTLHEDIIRKIVVDDAVRSRMKVATTDDTKVEIIKNALIDQNNVLTRKLNQVNADHAAIAEKLQETKKEADTTAHDFEMRIKLERESRELAERALATRLDSVVKHRVNAATRYGMFEAYTILGFSNFVILAVLVKTALLVYSIIADKWNAWEPTLAVGIPFFLMICSFLGLNLNVLHIRSWIVERLRDWAIRRSLEKEGLMEEAVRLNLYNPPRSKK